MTTIFLGQPYAGTIELESLVAAVDCAPGLDVVRKAAKCSLTAKGFNLLLAEFRDGDYDYFAMLHSDVSAPAGWLGAMVAMMEKTDFDLLHAPCGIKDDRGLTSTAVAFSRDIWGPKRRITTRELERLPMVFSAESLRPIFGDVYCLLPNTGCMLLRGDWLKDCPAFTIIDRIVKRGGKHKAENVSEDWLLGYWLAERGLKAGAIKIPTTHYGRTSYSTAKPWGEDRDGLMFPWDVEGWLTDIEGVALARLAKGKCVLEVGSYCGKSTICMAQTAESVTVFDPFDGRATADSRDTLNDFNRNLRNYGVADKVTIADWPNWPNETFDMVFIDGAHDYESVATDIDNARNVLAPSGLLVFHDYRTIPGEHDGRWDAGVTQAVNELLEAGARIVERHGSVAVVRLGAVYADA